MCHTSGLLVNMACQRPYTWIRPKKTHQVLFRTCTVLFGTFSSGTYYIEYAEEAEHTQICVELFYILLWTFSKRIYGFSE